MAIDKITNKRKKLIITFNQTKQLNVVKNESIQKIFNFAKKENKNVSMKERNKQLIITFNSVFGLFESLDLLKSLKNKDNILVV